MILWYFHQLWITFLKKEEVKEGGGCGRFRVLLSVKQFS